MIILVFVVLLVLLCLIIIARNKFDFTYDYDEVLDLFSIVDILVMIACVISIVLLIASIASERTIDKKIEMYTTINLEKEETFKCIVENYQQYKQEIFKDIGNYADIVLQYLKLHSDALVLEQMNQYNENKKEIVELKKQKIDIDMYKWWLYFGGKD